MRVRSPQGTGPHILTVGLIDPPRRMAPDGSSGRLRCFLDFLCDSKSTGSTEEAFRIDLALKAPNHPVSNRRIARCSFSKTLYERPMNHPLAEAPAGIRRTRSHCPARRTHRRRRLASPHRQCRDAGNARQPGFMWPTSGSSASCSNPWSSATCASTRKLPTLPIQSKGIEPVLPVRLSIPRACGRMPPPGPPSIHRLTGASFHQRLASHVRQHRDPLRRQQDHH